MRFHWLIALSSQNQYENTLSDENTFEKEALIWPGGIPDNNPKCDYDGSDCLPGTDMAMWEFRFGFLHDLIGS